LKIDDDNSSFELAYIVRAVTIGQFVSPPALIEDMYQPIYRAFSKFNTHKLLIKSPKDIAKEQTIKYPTIFSP
jgi:uncharacterized protein YfaS (alpha-2-macroglobulin family)